MNTIYILLNIIQAVAEFLPISSSGHLVLTEWLYDITEHGLEAFLHLPTALVIAVVLWKPLLELIKTPKEWPVYLASIVPAGLIGLLLGDYIDAVFYSPIVIGINSLIWGIIMFYVSRTYKESNVSVKAWTNLSIPAALRIGFAQALALIPGTSRSGVTTLAGIWSGMKPSDSAKFSFFSGFPLILMASIVGFAKLIVSDGFASLELSTFTLFFGFLLSFFIGYICIQLFTSKHTLVVLRYSGIYRIILGLVILIWLV